MREAAGLLSEIGINRESARTALAAGLAGEVRRAGGAHLVEECSVRAVIARAAQQPRPGPALAEALHEGIFTARLGPRRETPDEEWRSWRGADLTRPLEEQLLGAAGWWSISWITRAGYAGLAGAGYLLPFVGVVAGIAVVGAEVTGIIRDPATPRGRRCRFELRPAGPWYDELRGRQLLTSPGPPWVTLHAGRIAG